MEYRFCLTPRLIALAIFSGVALMVLLFALGYQVGQHMAPPAPGAQGSLLGEARKSADAKLDAEAAKLAAPLKKVAP
jgi:hypothetical protein